MAVVLFSCEKKFDLKMDGEKIIFVECFPGIKDFIALKVLPALPLNCDYDINSFSPDVKLMVNGDMVEVKYMEQGDSLRGIPAGYWVAEYAPLPDDKVKVAVSADGFETVESETVVPIPLSDYKLDYEVYDAVADTVVVLDNKILGKPHSKEEAFANLDFDPNSPVIPGTNATQAWNKAGKPIPGTLDFKRFIKPKYYESARVRI